MDGRKLTLKDGTAYPGGEAGLADGVLWCYLQGESLGRAYADFADGEKTGRIAFAYGEEEKIYEGYTALTCIRLDRQTGDVAIRLEKEAAEGGQV